MGVVVILLKRLARTIKWCWNDPPQMQGVWTWGSFYLTCRKRYLTNVHPELKAGGIPATLIH